MKHNSVTTIKCRFSNSAHELLDPNYGNKNREAWKTKNKVYTNAEKIEIFDKLKKVHDECSEEIGHALFERREKKRIHNQRVINGYYEKRALKNAKHKENHKEDLVN